MKVKSILTVVSALYIVVVGVLFRYVPLAMFNVLLVTVSVPMVRLIWAFCRWSAYQHSRRWARDIERVHGPRVRPRTEQSRGPVLEGEVLPR